MNIPSLKLKFQVSQNTRLDNSLVRSRIEQKLTDGKYIIRASTDNNIEFGRRMFELVWNFQAPYILDCGNFQLDKTGGEITVTLNYFIKFLYPLLVFFAVIVGAIIQGMYFAIPFLISFILITSLIQYFITKSVGKSLLSNVLDEND